MKKHLKIPLLLTTQFILTGLFFYGFSYAQELISEPIEEPTFIEEESTTYDPYAPENEPDSGDGGDGTVPLKHLGNSHDASCTYDYMNWKKSTTLKKSLKWNLHFLNNRAHNTDYALSNYENERFVDLNGDGLVDYLYSYKQHTYTSLDEKGCVYLNTGSGFKKEYQCVIRVGKYNKIYYHGDCAG